MRVHVFYYSLHGLLEEHAQLGANDIQNGDTRVSAGSRAGALPRPPSKLRSGASMKANIVWLPAIRGLLEFARMLTNRILFLYFHSFYTQYNGGKTAMKRVYRSLHWVVICQLSARQLP